MAQLAHGEVGERIGRGAIVCGADTTFVLDETGTCSTQQAFVLSRDGHPVSTQTQPARCGFLDDHRFRIDDRAPGSTVPHELAVDGPRIGELLSPEQLHARGIGRAADLATARAVVEADLAANVPAAIARTAGGKIGDATTVAGLIATYAADPVDGRAVRIAAVVVHRDLDGLWIADPGHRELSIYCGLADHADALRKEPVVGARVRVHGAVGKAYEAAWTRRHTGIPKLEGCTVEK